MRRARLDMILLLVLVGGTALWFARAPRPGSEPVPVSASPSPPVVEMTPALEAGGTPVTVITATPTEPLLDQQQVEFEQAAESAILRKLGEAVVDSHRTYDYSFTNLGVDSRPASTGARLTHSLTQLALPLGATVPAYRISAVNLYVREILTPEQQKQVRNLVLTTLRSQFAGGARLNLTFGGPSHGSRRPRL